ncbi:DUF3244 domain-containing protein (plasmid) [Pedobacter sp. BS3]|uniref:pectinesterase family protein n=1 Tax=Pedobacter sp. BS3 TaxID=2567937 RepID=UPI0011EF75FD|nr:pectinesterase family protein [Pedobacter sp. BS3]TZF86166.1 DUF3244 domain-containing protein [Pedobacter sp. BS3]
MKTFFTFPLRVCLMFVGLLCSTYVKAASYDAVVDKNGTGDYTTIQAALDAAPASATSPYRIYIKSGVYYENLTIAKPFIQFIGESAAKTIITYNNYNGKAIPGGGGTTYGTANSASVIITADDFSAANITFENSTGDAPQALAINVSGDRASFKNCRFLGGQDTFLGYNSKYPQSLYKCYIEGVVDFIFGNSKTVFDECTIYARDRSDNNGSYITASNTRETRGFVFRNCEIIANRGTTKYVLGRPWQNDANTASADKSTAATVFINTKMSSVVKPEGWSVWDAGTDVSKIIYAEYNSMDMSGDPLDVSSRVSWSKQLNSTEAAEYLDNSVMFKDRNNNIWDPYSVFPDGQDVPVNRLAISNFKYVKSGTELTFTWNLNWPESNVTYKLYRITDGGAPVLVNEQTIADNNVNVSYTPATGKETVPPSMSTYEYYVEASSANGTVRSESVMISAIPVINLTGTLQAFKQGSDAPSQSQPITISGEYLQENVTITPPANFEVSADNGTTWYNSANPLILNISGGLLTSKTVLVRLNASAAGTSTGNLTIVSGTGSHNKSIAVSGETYDHPLVNSQSIASLSLAQNAGATYLKEGLESANLDLNTYILSDKTSGTNIPYSTDYGIQFGPTAAGGGWNDNAIKNMTDKSRYIEITLKTASTHEARADSLLFNLAVFQTTGNFALEYSTDDFATSTLLQNTLLNGSPVAGTTYGSFTNGAFALANQNTGAKRYAFALNGATGVRVAAGEQLKVRMYFRTGSSSDGRYITLKDIDFKGSVGLAAAEGDYKTVSSGSWLDVSIWAQMVGGVWTAAATPPHYGTGHTSFIESGHIVTAPNSTDLNTAYNSSYGYVNSTVVREGGKLIVESGKTMNVHHDQLYQIDGELENNGTINNDGKYDLIINGTVTNNGTLKVDQTGSNVYIKGKLINKASVNYNYVTVKDGGVYEHAANSNTMPATITFEDGSTFLISGITTSQTGILKNTISYYNVTWDNPGQTKYYAFQGNLVENIRGKFTVNNTGSQYLALLNANGTVGLGSYEQNGGRVLVRENSTVNAVINVAGDFMVNGGTLESNSAVSVEINLKGADSKYQYNDATNLLTGLKIDVTGNYTLQSPLTVNNLNIADGKITLGDNTLTASTVARTGTGYIVTNGAGTLTVKSVGPTDVLFPVGTASGYNPLILSNTGTISDFAVKVKTGLDHTLPSNNSKSVNLQWDVTPATAGGKVDITFQWNTADQNSGFDIASPVVAANYHNGSYVGYTATVSGSNPYMAKITGIDIFSPFVVANELALPLKMLSFTAKLTQQLTPSVVLNWQTADEVNTSNFEVERAGADLVFVKIGSQSAFNTSGTNNYSFTDVMPMDGTSYYRIKQVDLDGKYSYSGIRAVENAGTLKLALYPNPVSEKLSIQCGKVSGNTQIRIISIDGKVVFTSGTINALSAPYTVDVSGLKAGFYSVLFTSGNNKLSGAFIKQ